jgi:acyl-coenzyme A thioesterase 13
MPEPAVLVFVRRVATAFQRAGGHDANCFPSLRILAARPGLVRASVRIRSENLNRLGTLHGGAICSLTDTLGSLALASRGLYSTGVSTDIK